MDGRRETMKRVDRKYVLDELRDTPSLGRADLRNLDMSCLDFRGVDFRNADLDGSDFSFAQLVGADFRGAEGRGVSFVGADCTGAQFDYSGWADTKVENMVIDGATFRGACIGKSSIAYVEFPDTEDAYNALTMGGCPFQWAERQL